MKKVFFLAVVLFCFAGSVWGQMGAINHTVTFTTCYNVADGKIEATISGVTGPYDVILIRGVVGVDTIRNTTSTNVTFSGLPASAQPYNIQVKVGAVTRAAAVGIYVNEPSEFKQADAPTPKNGGCGQLGTIEAKYTGGVLQGQPVSYNYTLTSDKGYSSSGTNAGESITLENLPEGIFTLTITDIGGCKIFVTSGLEIISALPIVGAVVDGSIVNVACKGENTGEATIEVQGGAAPYYFYIDYTLYDVSIDGTSVAGALPEGIFIITVIDAGGCIDNVLVEIKEPDHPLSAIISNVVDVPDCFGDKTGAFMVTGQGGTSDGAGQYSYTVNETKAGASAIFNLLGAGTYPIEVRDANNCIFNTSQEITQPVAVSFTATAVNNDCAADNNGKITITSPSYPAAEMQYQLRHLHNH